MKRFCFADSTSRLRFAVAALICLSGLTVHPTSGADSTMLAWLPSREAGIRDAQLNKRPILVRFGGDHCVWCRKLDQELEKPAVQQALKNWTLVSLDVERSAFDARALGVEAIPALRVLSSTGRLLESTDGFLPEEKLTEWLKKALEQTEVAQPDNLFSSAPPTEIELQRFVRQFGERDPSIREAAIRRLIPHPAATSEVVVEAFKKEKLGVRLAALEVLREWQAPLEGLDPWRPETMTADRFAKIDEWRTSIITAPPESRSLSPSLLAEVRAELDQLLKADASSAAAIRERLARYKEALLPEVVARLKQAANDEDRYRLLALRYRLVMEDAVALNSPGLVDRLAATDARTRHLAVRELTEKATPATQPLFLELFADSDSLVRELSLVGLRAAAGDDGTSALMKLLDDPEPNVRAAVLKLFAENPWPELKPRLAEFMKSEKETGLLVHAVRCFRKLKNRSSDDLIPLLKHSEWQVRAEALDALTGAWQRYPDNESKRMLNDADVRVAVAECLDDEDPFVVSRAILGVKNHPTKKIITSLLKIPAKHDSLMTDVVAAVSSASQYKSQVMPTLKEFFASPAASRRAVAIRGLGNLAPNEIQTELIAALQDESRDVRIAGAATLQRILKTMRPTLQNGILRIPSPNLKDDEEDESIILPLHGSNFSGVIEVEAEVVENPNRDAPQAAMPEPDADSPGDPDSPKESEAPATPDIPDAPGDAEAPEQATEEMEAPVAVPGDARRKPSTPRATGGGGFLGFVQSLFGGPSPVPAPHPTRGLSSSNEDGNTAQTNNKDVPGKALEAAKKRDEWIGEFREGKHRPAWLETMIPPLEKMFASENTSEQIASAVPLVALGRGSLVQPQLVNLAKTGGEDGSDIIDVLEWLTFAERETLSTELLALPNARDLASKFLEVIPQLRDSRDAVVLWNLTDLPRMDPEMLMTIKYSLQPLYFGDRHWDTNSYPVGRKKEVYEIAASQLSSPRGWKHILALVQMSELTNGEEGNVLPSERQHRIETSRAAAQALVDDETLEKRIRDDAYQLTLIVMDADDRKEALAQLLTSPDEAKQLLALNALLQINGGLGRLKNSHLDVSVSDVQHVVSRPNEQIQPEPPPGLTVEIARPMMASGNAEIRALAGYVLAVSEDPSGLTPLLAYWRSLSHQDDEWDRLVYRAIAATDDSTLLPTLRHIYASLDDWRVKEFYWTIRIMTGPKILEFRKQIRAEKANSLR